MSELRKRNVATTKDDDESTVSPPEVVTSTASSTGTESKNSDHGRDTRDGGSGADEGEKKKGRRKRVRRYKNPAAAPGGLVAAPAKDVDPDETEEERAEREERELMGYVGKRYLDSHNNRMIKTSTKLDICFYIFAFCAAYYVAWFYYGIDLLAVIYELALNGGTLRKVPPR